MIKYINGYHRYPLPFPVDGKRRNLDATELAKIERQDTVQRQFLATADFTPDRRRGILGSAWEDGDGFFLRYFCGLYGDDN